MLEVARHRSNETIAQENPQESTNQGRTYTVAEHFGRLADFFHREYYTQHGGHNTKPRKCVSYVCDAPGRYEGLLVMRLDFVVEKRTHFVRFYIRYGESAQGVGKEGQSVMILEKLGVLLKNCAFFRFVQIAFDRNEPFFPDLVKYLAQQDKRIHVVAAGVDPALE